MRHSPLYSFGVGLMLAGIGIYCIIGPARSETPRLDEIEPLASERQRPTEGWQMHCGCDSRGGYCIHYHVGARLVSIQPLGMEACTTDGRIRPSFVELAR